MFEETKQNAGSKINLKQTEKKDGSEAAKLDGQSPVPQKAPIVTMNADTTTTDSKRMFYLAHASKNDTASVKASIAAQLFKVPIARAPSQIPTMVHLEPILHGPALLSPCYQAVAFGGNSILKAMSLLSPQMNRFDPRIDEWLELERTCLRHGASVDCADSKVSHMIKKIEDTLGANSGYCLVGDSVSAADIAIVVSLSDLKTNITGSYSATIQDYLKRHTTSEAFVKGLQLLEELIPRPAYDWRNNPSVIRAVTDVFESAVISLFPTLIGSSDFKVKVEKSKQLKFGDYQCLAGMQIFQKLKGEGKLSVDMQSPSHIAKSIVAAISDENFIADSFEVNGPGFILCKVKTSFLEHHIDKLVTTGKVSLPENILNKGETVVVDFSSPNIAKDMHVGHLRSTIIGESACRILEFVGADVKRVNHVGDWGTQFGMLITYLKEHYPEFKSQGANVDIGDLTNFYKKAKQRFDEDPEFKKSSQLNVVNLQAGDVECHMIWNILCDISRREFEKVYQRLDITLEERGESFYNSRIPPVIKEFENAGLIKVEEGGAKCVFVPGFKVPVMLQKSDGGFGYDSTDMAALKFRLQEIGASRIVYITDFSQGDHFQLCFAAANMIGWVDPKKHKLEHIGFGTVMGEDGKRFKTRSGDTVRLVDLLDEAVSRMETNLRERIAESKANITIEELPVTAAAMGYGAVKYFDLRRNPTSNYKFSYDEMLDTKGNTAIYLLYAHARLESICTKGKNEYNVDVDDLMINRSAKVLLDHPAERVLALQLQMFSDMIEEVLEDLFPYRICDYIYAVSNAVADFVTQCKVLGAPEMNSRLLLCKASAIVMRQCFTLLGIRHVTRI